MRSLKMGLPKVVLAEIISKGCRFRFQGIDTEFPQAELKGHSKKRQKLVFTVSITKHIIVIL